MLMLLGVLLGQLFHHVYFQMVQYLIKLIFGFSITSKFLK